MGDRIAVMSLGVLQQLDTPQNLYDKPANKFVAGFIGSPSMNFVDTTIEQKASQHLRQRRRLHLRVPDDKVAPSRSYIGQASHARHPPGAPVPWDRARRRSAGFDRSPSRSTWSSCSATRSSST